MRPLNCEWDPTYLFSQSLLPLSLPGYPEMTTVGFKGLWGESLLPCGEGMDSLMLTSEASREGCRIRDTQVPALC